MLLDASLAFVPYGSPLSMVLGAGVAGYSSIIDLTGSGVGVNAAQFGMRRGLFMPIFYHGVNAVGERVSV